MSYALLIMDFQAGIVSRLADSAPLLERTAKLIADARAARVLVIYVVVGFRPGYPEVDARNMAFSGLAQTGMLQSTTPGSDIVPAVAPQPGDVVVMKHRVGPFLGTDLEQVLRAKRVDTLVLAGISTSGVVLSTVRYAADNDFVLQVVEDCCADPDPEVHRLLTQKVFPRQAKVIPASEVSFA